MLCDQHKEVLTDEELLRSCIIILLNVMAPAIQLSPMLFNK